MKLAFGRSLERTFVAVITSIARMFSGGGFDRRGERVDKREDFCDFGPFRNYKSCSFNFRDFYWFLFLTSNYF